MNRRLVLVASALVVLAILFLPAGAQAQASQTLTFDDLSSPNRPLSGQYPSGLADWGNGTWWLASPWGRFTTNSISTTSPSQTSGSITLLSPRRLVQVDVYNGGTATSTITLACAGQATVSVLVPVGALQTIATGWAGTCSSLTIGSTNGWNTNFDNLVLAGAAGTPTSTPAPTSTPTPGTPAATPSPTVTATPVPHTTRIMPLGDSITYGQNDISYRYDLYQMLRAAGYQFDFVGSNVSNPCCNVDPASWDADNEGHSGYSASALANGAAGWAQQSHPDIVLLHAGGVNGGDSDNVHDIITGLRSVNPSVKILLAEIIPMGGQNWAAYNQSLVAMAAQVTTAQSPVIIVDQSQWFLPSDFSDGTHPNERGDLKMATRWFVALERLLN